MLHALAIFIILCSSAIAAPLSLLRGSEPDGLTKVEPGRNGWFAHGSGDGLLGNLGDVLSGSLLDGMSGEDTVSHRAGLVRQAEAEPALFAGNTFDTNRHDALNGPKLPPTRVSINFGVSVDVGELPSSSLEVGKEPPVFCAVCPLGLISCSLPGSRPERKR